MTYNRTQHIPDILAKIVSIVFHPLLIPLYGLLVIFSAPTPIWYIPVNYKKVLLLLIIVNNLLLPLSLMPYFRYRNIITSWAVEERKERILPLIMTSFFYSVTAVITYRFQILPHFIKSFILSAAFLAICVTVITFWWKISIHSTGVGALTALVIILSLEMYTPLTWYLFAVVLVSGLVLSSRLWLNDHNPVEVWSGLMLGFAGAALFLMIF